MTTPPVCNYEGSRYQSEFWEQGGREYEDRCEAIALKRLLPRQGHLLLELGAGAGRNTPRCQGYERIVLLDYSFSQLQQAVENLGSLNRLTYVAADIYRLPFVDGLFDAATMIRTLHHMADAPLALGQIRRVLQPGATFILEFANKRNLKAIMRYLLQHQDWNPFSIEPVEFEELNFDFHPRAVFNWLKSLGFRIDRVNTVSHFRIDLLKRKVRADLLAAVDGLLQPTGRWFQWSPSVFLRARLPGQAAAGFIPLDVHEFFACPICAHHPLELESKQIVCPTCRKKYPVRDGIHDFRTAA